MYYRNFQILSSQYLYYNTLFMLLCSLKITQRKNTVYSHLDIIQLLMVEWLLSSTHSPYVLQLEQTDLLAWRWAEGEEQVGIGKQQQQLRRCKLSLSFPLLPVPDILNMGGTDNKQIFGAPAAVLQFPTSHRTQNYSHQYLNQKSNLPPGGTRPYTGHGPIGMEFLRGQLSSPQSAH